MGILTATVNRGVHFLNGVFGLAWLDLIDLEKFDIGDENHCVLGQVYGSYSSMMEQTFVDPEGFVANQWVQYHGFSASYPNPAAWRELRDEWVEALIELGVKPKEPSAPAYEKGTFLHSSRGEMFLYIDDSHVWTVKQLPTVGTLASTVVKHGVLKVSKFPGADLGPVIANLS